MEDIDVLKEALVEYTKDVEDEVKNLGTAIMNGDWKQAGDILCKFWIFCISGHLEILNKFIILMAFYNIVYLFLFLFLFQMQISGWC